MGSGQSTPQQKEAPALFPPPAAGTSAKPAAANPSGAAKPKPCCVCLDEKAERDKCMLFSQTDNAQIECAPLVEKYKKCMASFGFEV